MIKSFYGESGWYEPVAQRLMGQIDFFYENLSITDEIQRPSCVIVPHAGYAYSGLISAMAFQYCRNQRYDKVIICGPSHFYPLDHTLAIPRSDSFENEQGKVTIDSAAIDTVSQAAGVEANDDAFQNEHSIGMILPFLQHSVPNTPIVPILFGQMDENSIELASKAIQSILSPNTLLVISSDFIHFGPRYGFEPFIENIENSVFQMDLIARDLICKKDAKNFFKFVTEHNPSICGKYAITALLSLLSSEQELKFIGYGNSGQVNQDWKNCVGYMAFAAEGLWQ